jgi:hypothetical protein
MALAAGVDQVRLIDGALRVSGRQDVVHTVAAGAIRDRVRAALRREAVIARQVGAGATAFHAELAGKTNAFVAACAGSFR